jgi:arylsulfatase
MFTGRNHHSVNMASITELATSSPGHTSVRPDSAATIAQILQLNGYNTAAFGKWHQTPVWETSASGPFNHWPTGEGFDKFYGFMGGETNQWNPALIDGTTPIDPPNNPTYHFSEDMITQAINWVRSQHALTPDKPFFFYLPFGATHAPHHVPNAWRDRYRGTFDHGWDQQREQTLARQKELGIVPQDCKLTKRHDDIPAWDTLTDDERTVAAHLMETYAGFAEHTDYQVERFVSALSDMGVRDNTLIFYILGDNGASGEGGLQGTLNEVAAFNGFHDTTQNILSHLDEMGGPMAYNHYPVGWAHAMDCPYQWTKQVASHWGGTRNGLIVHWPRGIPVRKQIRHQWHHVIDITPTILETAGLPHPVMVNGVHQQPMEGVSFAYTFTDEQAPDRHTTQYFEMFGNRGIYHEGWSACTKHATPWELAALPAFDDDVWELYTPDDWSQAHNVAKQYPEKLHELQQLFLIEAAKYQVFPLEDRRAELFNSDIAGRPDLLAGRKSMTLYPGMTNLNENTVPNVKNKSFAVSAEVVIPQGRLSGAIIAQGGRFAGWCLYCKAGVLAYCHNWLGRARYYVRANQPLPPGRHTVRFEFHYDGGGVGKGGTGTLYVNDQQMGQGRIDQTVPFIFSADDFMDIGKDTGTPVTEDYETPQGYFTGEIAWVRIDLGMDVYEDAAGQVQAVEARA